jgi:anti-sigma B factor antagonist
MDLICASCRTTYQAVSLEGARCPRCERPAKPPVRYGRALAALPVRFACEVEGDGATARVRPSGELDLATVDELSARLAEAARSARRVLLDLGGLTFIDSSGVRLLMRWARDAERDGIDLTLRPGGPAVREVLEVTGVRDLLPFE